MSRARTIQTTFDHYNMSPSRSPSTPRKRKRRPVNSDPSDVELDEEDSTQHIRFETPVIVISDSEDDIQPRSRGKRLKRKDPTPEPESEQDEIHVPRSSQRIVSSDVEDEDTPKAKKFVRGARPPTPDNQLAEEVETEHIIDQRLRTRGKKSNFQKNLEKLKQQRRKDDDNESGGGNSEEEVNQEAGEDDEGSDWNNDSDTLITPFKGARRDADNESSDDEASEPSEQDELEDDTFIVSDEDDESGAPRYELPEQFRGSQDLNHQYKVICQLLVRLGTCRKSERAERFETDVKDDYFGIPLRSLRRKIEGMRDSIVASSLWDNAFKKKLSKFPDFEIENMEFSVPHCDACHLGGRVATLKGVCTGLPYQRNSYADLESEESEAEDSEDSSDESESDKSDKAISFEINLGSNCAQRVKTYHKFTHWEYHLFHNLLKETKSLKKKKRRRYFVRMAGEHGVPPPKDLSDVNGLMDWLDSRGVIEAEWKRINGMMQKAHDLEPMAAREGETYGGAPNPYLRR